MNVIARRCVIKAMMMFTGYNSSEFMTQFNNREKGSRDLFDLK